MSELKVTIGIIVGIIVIVALCNMNGCRNSFKHLKSSTLGINRTVTLYDAGGGTIRKWETDSVVQDRGGTAYFLDNKGKAITVSGTFVIEEK